MSAAELMLADILAEVDGMGIGTEQEVNGADAVDYLESLQTSLRDYLKIPPPAVESDAHGGTNAQA